jgi:hypothetical protein
MELLGAHSCQHCQNLVLNFDEEKIDGSLDECYQYPFEPSRERRNIITFDFTIRNLQNAATEGCLVCEGYLKSLGTASSRPSDNKLTVERIYNTIWVGTVRMDCEVSLQNRSFHKAKGITCTMPGRSRTVPLSPSENFKIVATSGMLKKFNSCY